MLLDENTQKILEAFSSDYKGRVYGSALAKRRHMNQKTVSNVLNKLEKEHTLTSSIEGKNKYYTLNKFNPDIGEVITLIEVERKISFLEKHKHLRDLFKKLEERSKGTLIVFGSYARGTSTKASDVDIFVMGTCSEVSDLETLYALKINIIRSDKKQFSKNETLIKEIINNHIILKGVEEFVELIW